MDKYEHNGKVVVKVGDLVDLAPLYMVRDIRQCPHLDKSIEVLIGSPEGEHGSMWVMLEEVQEIVHGSFVYGKWEFDPPTATKPVNQEGE
jgi:hypothetical protein